MYIDYNNTGTLVPVVFTWQYFPFLLPSTIVQSCSVISVYAGKATKFLQSYLSLW